jgi:transposase-like protein
MTDFKSKTYTNEQIEGIIAEYKQSGKAITVFCKDRGHKPAYQTLKGWLDAAGEGIEAKAPATKAAPTTLEGMRAEMARQQQALLKQKEDYIDLLKSEVVRLKVELAKAEQELEEFTAL